MGVDWVIAEYDKLSRMIEAAAVTASETIDSIIGAEFEFDEISADTQGETPDQAVAEVEDAPVVRFLHKMLLDAFSMRASDIHFEPYEHNYRVRFRIDGELREIASPPTVIKDKLASRIKVISRLDISEKRIPQDGRMKLKIGPDRVIDFRVSTLPTLFGEKIVIRILDPSSARLGIDALGYDARRKRTTDASHRPSLRHGAGHRPHGLGQDRVAVHLPEPAEQAGRQHRDSRRPIRNQSAGRQSGQRE